VIGAFLRAPASMLTPYTYLQILWSTAYGYLVFDHMPDGWSGVGMGVIVGSGLLLALHERRWGAGGDGPRSSLRSPPPEGAQASLGAARREAW